MIMSRRSSSGNRTILIRWKSCSEVAEIDQTESARLRTRLNVPDSVNKTARIAGVQRKSSFITPTTHTITPTKRELSVLM